MTRQLFTITLILSAAISLFAGDKKPPSLTFLDTLNKSKEVTITAADYPPPPGQTLQPAAAQPQPQTQPVAVDTAAAKKGAKHEAGVVPSRFKIQVLAGTQEQQVKKEKNVLGSKINLPLNVSFETPYYKLYAGDFTQRSEAENYLAQIKQLGYNDAWIVRTAETQH